MSKKAKKTASFAPIAQLFGGLSQPNPSDAHNIYQGASKSPEEEHSDSSFQLDQEEEAPEQNKQNLQKLLDRLGLKQQLKKKNNNQDLEIVVNNFLQNCIGTVNRQNNTEQYDQIYDSQYQEKLKAYQSSNKGTIFISELTELEKIRQIPDEGLWALFRRIRLFLKYISMVCEKIVGHAIFEAFILIIILLNSVKMAMDDPLATDTSLPWAQTTFTIIYVIQMITKIFAFGFILNKGSYLRDLWNVLDFIIVVTSLLPLIINIGFSVNALRAIRVLRPLRTITKVKALKMIVKTLFNSFSLVMDSLCILFMVMGIFAIAGMQLFGGTLKYTCMVQSTGVLSSTLCQSDSDCSVGSICVKGISSPQFSMVNFDTLFWSFMAVFQTITCQGWSLIMIYIEQTKGLVYAVYSVLIVITCLYILLNMTMAILKYKYSQVKKNNVEEEEEDLQQYEPDFLRKIGIFNQMSALSEPAALVRINHPFRQQIGSSLTLPPQEKTINMSTQYLISHLDAKKGTQIPEEVDPDLIDLNEIRQHGKYNDFKWDANNLVFETNIISEKEIKVERNDSKPISEKQLGDKQQQVISQEEDSSFSDDLSSEYEEQSSKELEIADKAMEMQNRFKSNKNIDMRSFKSIKKLQEIEAPLPPLKKMRSSIKRQMSDFDHLLQLIGTTPGMSKLGSNSLNIPDLDFNKVVPEKIYEKFADLGQYKIRRIEKGIELGSLQVAKKGSFVRQHKKKPAPMQQVIQQNALDIKELHLKNQLLKMKLRCRVKSDDLIDEERKYDITRVIVSQKLKQIQSKKNQIKDNMNSMTYSVRYRHNHDKASNQVTQHIYSRNLQSQKVILKVPQINYNKQKIKSGIDKDEANSNGKAKDNTHFLRMLQNHQMQQKIDLKLERIMSVFFKKENNRNKSLKSEQSTPQEDYQLVHEEDILKRHGHLQLEYPFAHSQLQTALEGVNMKGEEYDIHIKGLLGLFVVMRKKLLLTVSHAAYDNFILLIVMLNTTLMSMNGYISTDLAPYTYINQAFTYIFIIDLTLKIFAYGINFFTDVMNLFDAGVVAVSIMEIALGSGSSNLSALRSIRILRAFRVLRITRLIRSLSYMRIIMGVVTSIITEFIYVFLLLSLFVFIYTLLGMQIFGGNFPSQTVTGIRQNYDTFFNALFTVFQVMTIENWNDIELATYRSSVSTFGIIFLLSWIFIGNWILLNLLQAILLDGFDGDSTDPQEEVGDAQEQQQTVEELRPTEQDQEPLISESNSDEKDNQKIDEVNQANPSAPVKQEDASLYIFQPDHPLRVICKKIAHSTTFEVLMFIIILCSSAKLAIDTYVDPSNTQMKAISAIADYVFNGLFILESLIKIIEKGFAIGQKTYLSNSWNRLDFGIVCISIIDMSLSSVNLSILKLMRTLRPLRIITRNEEMKIMVTSLAQSFLGIFNVLIICLCVFLMFAILGMNLLQGKLNYCNETGSQLITGNYGPFDVNQVTCQASGGVWATQLVNFQNIATSMMSLYIFSTRENWPFYVFSFIDGTEDGPVKDNSQIVYFLFAVLFIFIGSLFFMDLLVGVMFLNYHEAQAKIRPKTLSNKQINWKNLQKLIVTEDPCFQLFLAPANKARKMLFEFVAHKYFELFIALVIVANILVMTISDDDISASMTANLTMLNSVFSYVFITELTLKLIAYGKSYFLSGWNIFDFFVVSASVFDIILQYSGVSSGETSAITILPQIARIFRVMRITRLLRMVKSFKGLQKLIETFVFSLPAIGKGLMILFLYLFISSILASNLMGSISYDYGGNMNDLINYSTFHKSMTTLFINLTGQNWYYFMFFSTENGFVMCNDGTSDSCISPLNYLFWLPFVFLGQKVFLQLFVLIVLDQFEANYINENNPLGIFSLFEDDFRENWIKNTTKYHSEKIQAKKLIDLMLALRPPLGLCRQQTLKKYEQQLESNQKLTKEEVADRLNELDKKLKKNAARLLHKMNVMKNRIYFGYHETFYNFAKLSIVPEFIDDATPEQLIALEAMHKESEQLLEKVKPAGNLFYYGELEGEENDNVPLNPISLILFTQIIIKGWHNYSTKNKTNRGKKDKKRNQLYDSLNNSCASDLMEAEFQKMPNEKKAIMRRGGLLQTRGLQHGGACCQFRPTPNMVAAYGQGKKTKHKVSILMSKRKSKNFVDSLLLGSRESSKIERSERSEGLVKKAKIMSPERNIEDSK